MKAPSRHPFAAVFGLLALASLSSQSWADPLYWDTNGSTPGSGNAAGTWDAGTNWSSDPAGATDAVAWAEGSAAVFAAGEDFGLALKTIQLEGSVRTPSITLEDIGLFNLTGGSLDLDGDLRIDTSVLGPGGGLGLNWNSALVGSGDLTLAVHGDTSDTGAGSNTIFTLSGTNTFQGRVVITSGVVGWSSNFGDPGNVLVYDGGGLVHNTGGTFGRDVEIGTVGIIRLYGSATTTYTGSISNLAGVDFAEVRHTDGGTLNLTGDGSGFNGTFVSARGTTNFVSENWQGTSVTLIQGELNHANTLVSADIQAGTANIGALSGSLTQNGGTTHLPGGVGGDVSLAGGTLNLGGEVGGIVSFSGGTLNLSSGTSLGGIELPAGPVRTLGVPADSSIIGDVITNFDFGGVTLNLGGTVTGNVFLDDGSGLGLRGGTIQGNLETGFDSFSETPWSFRETLRVDGNVTLTGSQRVSFTQVPAPGEIAVLLDAGGSISGDGADPLDNFELDDPASYRSGDFSLADGKIALDIGGTGIAWSGEDEFSPGFWDAGLSANWSGGDTRFFNGDAVSFGNVETERNLSMIGLLVPFSITFDNDTEHPYTVGGAGRIGGTTGIVKRGSGRVTFGGANGQNFTGPVLVEEGTLALGSRDAFGLTSGVTVAEGGQVDINGQTPGTIPTGGYTYRISGHGPDGNGAIVLGAGSTASNAGIKTLILEADATLGAIAGVGSRFDVGFANTAGFGSIQTNGHTITAKGPGSVYFRGPASSDFKLVVENARAGIENFANAFGGAGGEVTVLDGSQVYFFTGAVYENGFTIEGEGWTEAGRTLGALRLQAGANLAGPVRLSGDAHIHAYNSTGTVSGVISEIDGPHSLKLGNALVNSTSTLTLANDNTYSGGTRILPAAGAGLIVRATADGAFGSGPVLYEGSAAESGAQPSARIDLLNVTIDNDFDIRTAGLLTGFRGVINTVSGNTLSVVNGDVLLRSGVGNGGHFSSLDGGVLRLNGAIHVSEGVTPNIRSGLVEVGGGGNYPTLNHGEGTLRLVAENGVNPDAALRLALSGPSTFDLNGHPQTVSQLIRAATAQATVTNNGPSPATLTVQATEAHSFTGVLTDGSGSLAFTKSGPGPFQLSGSHSYSGDTTVASGSLTLTAPYLADSSAVRIGAGAVLNLIHEETDLVRALFVNGVQQAAGTYQPADHAFLTGTGSLQVATGPGEGSPYDDWAASFGLDPFSPSGAPGGDFDRDGLANMVEFVLGSPPDAASNADAPEIEETEAGLVFRYRRSKAALAAGFVPLVEYGSSLETAELQTATPAMTQVADDGEFELVTVIIPHPPGSDRLFARLRVTAP